mgnify:CR=1 FL=1
MLEKIIERFTSELRGSLKVENKEGFLIIASQEDKKDNDLLEVLCTTESTPELTMNMICNVMENSEMLSQVFILSVFTFIGGKDKKFLNDHIEFLSKFK